MRITIWGCRGSLPTPGPQTLRYGGNTTCLEVRLEDGSVIVIDAGSGLRALGKTLLEEEGLTEIYLFLTHSHWDHLMGFPFFGPAFSGRFKIHVRGGPLAKDSLRRYLEHQMQPPYFPVEMDAMKAAFDFTQGRPKVRKVGAGQVIPIELSHPNGGYGFKIVEDHKQFVFLTDNELDLAHPGSRSAAEYRDFCQDVDLLLHDAQYNHAEYEKTRGWGHSTFDSALDLGLEAGARRFGAFHHDPDRGDEELDRIASSLRETVQRRGADVDSFVVSEGMEIEI